MKALPKPEEIATRAVAVGLSPDARPLALLCAATGAADAYTNVRNALEAPDETIEAMVHEQNPKVPGAPSEERAQVQENRQAARAAIDEYRRRLAARLPGVAPAPPVSGQEPAPPVSGQEPPEPGREPAWLMQERATRTREWLRCVHDEVKKAVESRDAEWKKREQALLAYVEARDADQARVVDKARMEVEVAREDLDKLRAILGAGEVLPGILEPTVTAARRVVAELAKAETEVVRLRGVVDAALVKLTAWVRGGVGAYQEAVAARDILYTAFTKETSR